MTDADVRTIAADALAHALVDARLAARRRYAAEVAGRAIDADIDTYELTLATGRAAGILELIGAAFGGDELGTLYAAAERVANRRDPESADYAPRSTQEVTP